MLCREYAWAFYAVAHKICQGGATSAVINKVPDTSILDSMRAPACLGMLACRPQDPGAHCMLAFEHHAASDHRQEAVLHAKAMKLAEQQQDPCIGALSAWYAQWSARRLVCITNPCG